MPAGDDTRREGAQSRTGRKRTASRGRLWRVLVPIAVFVVISIAAIVNAKPSGTTLLKQATASFGKIERGTFDFQINITPNQSAGGQPASIRLTGPFELKSGEKLPSARIQYTVSSGGQSQTTTLITTGSKAYVEVQGQAYELPASAVKQLASASAGLRSKGGGANLAGLNLHFDRWLLHPKVSDGGEMGGQKTWLAQAGVNVAEALADLATQAKALGAVTGSQLPAQLSKSDIAKLNKSITNASVSINVGRYDKLLRRFDLKMDVAPGAKGTSGTPGAAGGRVEIVVAISDPNQPVNVTPPPNPLSYKALQSLGAGSATGR